MAGVSDLFWAYQNAGTAVQIILALFLGYVWKWEVKPRLAQLETTQDSHEDRLDDKRLNDQERDILLDDAHERLDQVDGAVARLRTRLNTLEQAHAAESGSVVAGRGSPRDSMSPDERSRTPDGGQRRPDGGDNTADASTRLRRRTRSAGRQDSPDQTDAAGDETEDTDR